MPTTESTPVAVVATIDVLAGQRDAVLVALREAVAIVRGEPGCESYVLHEDPATPQRLVMIERWSSMADLERHAQAPAFLRLAAQLHGRAELQVQTLKPLF